MKRFRQLGFAIMASVSAIAATCFWHGTAHANFVGSEFELFNPTTRADYFTVHTSRILDPGQFNLGVVLDFSINSLPKVHNGAEICCDEREGYADLLIVSHFLFGVGLTDRWDIGLSMPVVIGQSNDENDKVNFNVKGVLETHINSKFRIWGDDWTGLAAVFHLSQNHTEDNPYTGKGDGLTYILELAYSRELSEDIDMGANLGYRWRDIGDNISSPSFPVEPIASQILWSMATSVAYDDDLRWIGELSGAHNLNNYKTSLDRDEHPAEVIFGAEYNRNRSPFVWQAGIGSEVTHAIGTADWRIFAGLNWQGSLWEKRRRLPAVISPEDGELYETKTVRPKPSEPVVAIEPAKPATPEAPTIPRSPQVESIVSKNITFKPGSHADIGIASLDELEQISSSIKAKPFKKIVVEGHTDSSGSAKLNQALSEKRAATIKGFLVKRYGMDANKIETIGFGDTKPVADNKTEEGRKMNRRVEFKVYW